MVALFYTDTHSVPGPWITKLWVMMTLTTDTHTPGVVGMMPRPFFFWSLSFFVGARVASWVVADHECIVFCVCSVVW